MWQASRFCFLIPLLSVVLGALPTSAQTMRDIKACQSAASDPDRAISSCTVFIRTRRSVDGRPLPEAVLSNLAFLRGLAYLTKEEARPAIADFSLALPSAQANQVAALLELRAKAHLLLKEFSSAIADLDRAVENAKQTVIKAESLNLRAAAYIMQHDYGRALSDLDALIALDPKYGQAFFTRAQLYQYKGQSEKADADYALAIKLDPANAKLYAGYKELDRAWIEYLKDIQQTNDYGNWSAAPFDAYQVIVSSSDNAAPSQNNPATKIETASCDLAAVHWKSTESIGTLAAYEDHVARFPNCDFVGLARERIAALQNKATPVSKTCAAGQIMDSDGECVRKKAERKDVPSRRAAARSTESPAANPLQVIPDQNIQRIINQTLRSFQSGQ